MEMDTDYEFDAAMYFDFTRHESLLEARAAEASFHSTPNYPPSPFVGKLVWREESVGENAAESGGSDHDDDLGVYGGVSNYLLYGNLQKDLKPMEFATDRRMMSGSY